MSWKFKGAISKATLLSSEDWYSLPIMVLPFVCICAITLLSIFWVYRGEVPAWGVIGIALLAVAGLAFLLARFTLVPRINGVVRQRAFFDGAFNALGTPCLVTDGADRIVYANDIFRKRAGLADSERLLGFDTLYAGNSDYAAAIYQLAQAAKEGNSAEREVRIEEARTPMGHGRSEMAWLRLSVAPFIGENEHPYNLWQLQDIGEDRAKQEEAFRRLQFIITYLDHAPAGFFSTLPNGQIDYLNATLAEWLGLDIAISAGEGFNQADVIGRAGAKLLAAIAPLKGMAHTETFALDLRGRAGTLIPVHLVHRVDYDSEAHAMPSRTLVLPRAISASDSASDLRLSRFINSVPLGIAEIGRDGILSLTNALFLTMCPKATRGALFGNLIVESERRILEENLAKAFAKPGEVFTNDIVIEASPPRTIEFSLCCLSDFDVTATIFAIDRTDSKTLEVQLAQSQKMQAVGQLASGIAHDFNNVLTPIIGFADLLLVKMRPTDPAFADVMNIKQNANRAANLVRQLLAFSRKQTLQPKIHSLTEAMSDLGNLLGRVLGEKIELNISHGRDLGLVLVDIHQFEQVIINLAVNARDAMADGGTLSVKTYNVLEEESRAADDKFMPPGEYVVCEVSDTGTGIPAEIRDKIWEPFFSTKEVGKGTGLGLSTVYGIIKQTGGFIFCESQLGRGTIFRIYLPRHYAKEEPKDVQAPLVQMPKRADFTGKGRILIVEDEDAVRAFAVRALSSRGYSLTEAESGEQALEIIAEDKKGFELIISDVVMPEMDGPTLLRELRKRGIRTKVIFVSGYAEDAFEKNLEGQTDFSFLPKPFSLKELIEKVKEVITE